MAKLGRPSKFTKELGDSICEQISISEAGLREICKKHKISYIIIKRELLKNESFRTQYARAKEEQADHMADEMIQCVNKAIQYSEKGINSFRLPSMVNAMRLKVDTLKWIASKLKPKKYGDKMEVEQTIKQDVPFFPDVSKNNSNK